MGCTSGFHEIDVPDMRCNNIKYAKQRACCQQIYDVIDDMTNTDRKFVEKKKKKKAY